MIYVTHLGQFLQLVTQFYTGPSVPVPDTLDWLEQVVSTGTELSCRWMENVLKFIFYSLFYTFSYNDA